MKVYIHPNVAIKSCALHEHVLSSSNARRFTKKESQRIIEQLTSSVIKISGGKMKIGDRNSEYKPWLGDSINHTIVIIYDYRLCNHPVTEEEWACVMGLTYTDSKLPVSNISWGQTQEFFIKLNALTHRRFRLPTEAEWEFAARGGVKDENFHFSGSNKLDRVGWYDENTERKREVMTKRPNQLGLYDMSGNVWEWCSDWYACDYEMGDGNFITDLYRERTPIFDPHGPKKGTQKVYRGGSFANGAEKCQVFRRDKDNPTYSSERIGFRIAESITT